MSNTAINTMTNTSGQRSELRGVFRVAAGLLVGYIAISAAALVFAVVERHNSGLVNGVVWIRGGAVLASSILLYVLCRFAEKGRTTAYRRLRLLSFIIPCGVLIIIIAPGEYPTWMKIEQVVCGALVLTIAILMSQPQVRAAFPKPVKKPSRSRAFR
ncbi:hypothetical protein GCM10011575_18830 [Microlunatus endophyticus]|uniref:Uncharacterized protein n=1 Tax=Microlunatus endophyticus TaxID=1716077 RepID=A0A917S5W5_9ACTN|nr:hypothetical protein [Microlunatus endophyticus]GGL60556.1 hypothetical protein GCM10011575_18830 [Microlunatus endophyticus]